MRYLVANGCADEPGGLLELLGGKMRLCSAGGAALPDYVAQFYHQQGVLLAQGYGLTESSPVISTCNPQAFRIGTVGPPIPGVEVRIADDGEVLTRGPHVMHGLLAPPGRHGGGHHRRLAAHRRPGRTGRRLSADHGAKKGATGDQRRQEHRPHAARRTNDGRSADRASHGNRRRPQFFNSADCPRPQFIASRTGAAGSGRRDGRRRCLAPRPADRGADSCSA